VGNYNEESAGLQPVLDSNLVIVQEVNHFGQWNWGY